MESAELQQIRLGCPNSEEAVRSGAQFGRSRRGAVRPRAARLLGLRASPRVLARIALATTTVFVTALLFTAQAGALPAQARVFSGSFGAPGANPGQLSSPSGVAIDEANGLAYVSDPGNERVDIFKRGGPAQYGFVSSFKVKLAGAIAVDNSDNPSDPTRGEVYIAGAGDAEEAEEGEVNTLYVYSPSEGQVARKIHIFKFKEKGGEEREEEFEEQISGVAVDASGTLWVYWEEEGIIDAFHKAKSGHEKSKLEWEPQLRRSMEERFECYARPAFAVAPDASAFYAGYERPNAAEECPGEHEETPDPAVVAKLDGGAPSPTTLIAELDRHNTTGAVTESTTGDVYLDDGSSLASYAPNGTLIQRFGEGHLTGGAGVAVDAATGEVLAPEAGQDAVQVFGLDGTQRAPAADSVTSVNLAPRSTELRAEIDPGGLATEVRFQYGTRDCTETPAACSEASAGTLAAGFGDVGAHVELEGLQPATAYYYRVLATNSLGTVEGTPNPTTFTTLPSPGVMPDGRGWELVSPPNKHGSTVETASGLRAGTVEASLNGDGLAWLAAGPVVSEPEGNRSFELSQLMSSREPGGWATRSLETPHTKGWGLLLPSPSEYHFFSPNLSTSLVEPTEYDLGKTEGVIEHPALSPLATEKTMYIRSGSSSPGEFQPLVTASNDTAGTEFGGGLDFLGATDDLKHVVFHSKVGLTATAPNAAGLYLWQQGAPLSLVSVLPDGTPAPDDGFTEPSLGSSEGLNDRGAISQDGGRVFWTEGKGFGLYMRDTVRGETIRLNSAQGHDAVEAGPGGNAVPEPPADESDREVRFQAASADGSKVLFTDTARLTEDSTQEPKGEESPTDLYEFELTSEEPLRGRLVDLSSGATGASADVLNLVPGSSTTGSAVYFVANGVLANGATPGRCSRDPEGNAASAPGAMCNLYVSEADPANPGEHTTRFIASLSEEDAADWGAGVTSRLAPSQLNVSAVTSSVSANGRYLAFMSDRPLTGYDNRDLASGQPDEEVFVYDSSDRRLSCASCNPGGSSSEWRRPRSAFDTELAGEGVGLLVDRSEIWHARSLAGSLPNWSFNINGKSQPAALYQPRYLSNDGRLFFNSADNLVAADTNEKEDVYEYEPKDVGSCTETGGCIGLISSGTSDRESSFLDASENGDDVFFVTAGSLVAADTDHSLDIYDAHVCTGSEPCFTYPTSSSPECESAAACRPPSSDPPPVEQPAPSTTFKGPGNTATVHVLPYKTTTAAENDQAADEGAEAREGAQGLPQAPSALEEEACRLRTRRTQGVRRSPDPQEGQAMTRGLLRKRLFLLAGLAMLVFLLGAAPALGAARWQLSSRAAPTNLAPGSEGLINVAADDLGTVGVRGASTPITITDVLPVGLKVTDASAIDPRWARSQSVEEKEEDWKCSVAEERIVTCTTTLSPPPYERLEVEIPVKVDEPSGTEASLPNEVAVHGGVAVGGGTVPPATLTRNVQISDAPVTFGLEDDGYAITAENEDGSTDTQAGSHPFQLTSSLFLNQVLEEVQQPGQPRKLAPSAPALTKDLTFNLPPGLLGNLTAAGQCSDADFSSLAGTAGGVRNLCPAGSAIGVAVVTILAPSPVGYKTLAVPLFNLEPAPGEPARFGFEAEAVPVVVDTAVDTGGDYGVTATVTNATAAAQVLGTEVIFWGSPSAESHDNSRGWACLREGRLKFDGEACAAAEPAPAPAVPAPADRVHRGSRHEPERAGLDGRAAHGRGSVPGRPRTAARNPHRLWSSALRALAHSLAGTAGGRRSARRTSLYGQYADGDQRRRARKAGRDSQRRRTRRRRRAQRHGDAARRHGAQSLGGERSGSLQRGAGRLSGRREP